nr:MAG TPA: hypothetical protein [Caudoviricetes sp.]
MLIFTLPLPTCQVTSYPPTCQHGTYPYAGTYLSSDPTQHQNVTWLIPKPTGGQLTKLR